MPSSSSSSSSSESSQSTPAVSKLKRKRDSSSDSSSSSEPGQTEDVAVLSRAAKRKERKAVLKKALPTESPAKKEKKEGQASRPLKRENSIWVGNLSYKTTPESLRRFFDGVGEVTRVHLPTKLGKASPGDPARRENRGYVCGSVVFPFFVSVSL
jgi:RNA recognition motif-containing protein